METVDLVVIGAGKFFSLQHFIAIDQMLAFMPPSIVNAIVTSMQLQIWLRAYIIGMKQAGTVLPLQKPISK